MVALSTEKFPKPIQYYKVLLFYGQNLVTAGHADWRKLRKICAPSFSEVLSVRPALCFRSHVKSFCLA